MSLRRTFGIMIAALCLAGCAATSTKPTPSPDGNVCGGITGKRCKGNEFCDLQLGLCSSPDAQGTCSVVPEICPKDLRPVCGCDGKTYGNDCERRAARVSKRHEGACCEKVSFTGCPRAGVEGGCVIVQDSASGTSYDISAAQPQPKLDHLVIEGTGCVDASPNPCMQGKRLKDVQWGYTKMKCPKAPKKKTK